MLGSLLVSAWSQELPLVLNGETSGPAVAALKNLIESECSKAVSFGTVGNVELALLCWWNPNGSPCSETSVVPQAMNSFSCSHTVAENALAQGSLGAPETINAGHGPPLVWGCAGPFLEVEFNADPQQPAVNALYLADFTLNTGHSLSLVGTSQVSQGCDSSLPEPALMIIGSQTKLNIQSCSGVGGSGVSG